MKLRFRGNTLRLRVNRREVALLAAGTAVQEDVAFPNSARFRYIFEPAERLQPQASFEGGVMRVAAPVSAVRDWARGESIGLYFDLAADDSILKVSIEKDLACVDGPPEEFDPEAFPRHPGNNC